MTAATEGGAGRDVRCPICMNITRWPSGDSVYLYSDVEQDYVQRAIDGYDAVRRADLRKRGYQPCQADSDDDLPDHFLPALYAEYDEALVIGFVGSTQSGKTHLLTAMIREVLKGGGLTPYGLRAAPLDLRTHQQFSRSFLNRFERGLQLEGTRRNAFGGAFAEALLISGPTGRRPVVFFDVAGEDLEEIDDTDRGGRFLVATTGVIFTYAPSDAPSRRDDQVRDDVRDLDEAYRVSMNRLTAYPGHRAVPAAITVTKADRLRFHAPADRWLRRPPENTLDAARIREESSDAYAYLRHVGAAAVLEPFAEFDRCTLHFVSATGKDVEHGERSYARGPNPIRVLEPLVSILAMAGVIPGPESEKVGLP